MNSSGFDFRRLRYFVAAAEELHVGRAAQRLGLTQPALSQHIRAIEDWLGVKLFLRANRRITLSEAGEAFLVEARAALRHLELARNAAQRAARGETGNVAIGYVSSALAEPRFVRALGAFRASHPDVTLEMLLRLAAVQIEGVRSQTVDIAVTRGPLPPLPEECESFVLAREPLVAALPRGHRLGASSSIALAELVQQDTLLQPDDPPGLGLAHTVRQLLAKADLVAQRTMVVNEMTSTLGLVAAGLGVALLPASARVLRLPGVVFRTLREVQAVSELVVVQRRFERSAAVRALLGSLRGGV